MASLEQSLKSADQFTQVLKQMNNGLAQIAEQLENFESNLARCGSALQKLAKQAQSAVSALNKQFQSGMKQVYSVVENTIKRLVSLFGTLGNMISSKVDLSSLANNFTKAFSAIGNALKAMSSMNAKSVITLVVLAAAIAGLVVVFAKFGPALTQSATGMKAFGEMLGLVGSGMGLIVGAATQLAGAGKKSIGVFIGMIVAVGLLALAFALLGPKLTEGATGMTAFGDMMSSVGDSMTKFAASAEQVAGGGKKTIIVFFGMLVAIGLLALAFALLGPMLTEGAVGIGAFGDMMKSVGNAMSQFAASAVQVTNAGDMAIIVFFGMLAAVALLAWEFAALGPKLTENADGLAAFGDLMETLAGSIDTFVKSAIELSKAGGIAIGVMFGMLVAVAVLGGLFAKFGEKLTANKEGLSAFANMMKTVSAAMSQMASVSVQLAQAGGLSLAALVVMVVAIGVLALVFAKLGPQLTLASFGMLAFGATMVLIGEALATMAPALEAVAMIIEALGIALTNIVLALGTAISQIIDSITGLVEAIANGLVEIGAAIAQIIDSITGLVEAISNGLVDIGTVLTELVTAISEGLTQVIEQIGETITQVIEQIGESVSQIVESVSTLVETIGTQITSIIDAISGGITQVVEAVGNAISGVLDSIAGIFDSMGNAALNAGNGMKMLAEAIVSLVKLNLIDLGLTLAGVAGGLHKIGKEGDALMVAGTGMMLFAVASMLVVSALQELVIASVLFAGAMMAVTETMTIMSEKTKESMEVFVSELRLGMATAVQVVTETIPKIIEPFGKLPESLTEVGGFAMAGLAEGIRANSYLAIEAANEVARKVEDTIRNSLKIKSPSRVMMSVGGFVTEGLADGITRTTHMVEQASAALAHAVVPPELGELSSSGILTSNVNLDDEELSRLQAHASQSVVVKNRQLSPKVVLNVTNNGNNPIDEQRLLQKLEDSVIELIESDLG